MSIPYVTRLELVVHFITAIRFKQTIFARGRHAVILHSKKTLSRITYSAENVIFTTVISKPPPAKLCTAAYGSFREHLTTLPHKNAVAQWLRCRATNR